MGASALEIVELRNFFGATRDFKGVFTRLFYNPDFDKIKDDYKVNALIPGLKKFSTFLGDRKFVGGDNVTFADFCFYEDIDVLLTFDENMFQGFENLKNYATRFREIPEIKAYLTSNRFSARPINNYPRSKWQ